MPNYHFDNEIYKTVAKNIKKYRLLNHLSIQNLADLTSISETYLKELESLNDHLKISIYDLYKISVILNVSINKFFENKKE